MLAGHLLLALAAAAAAQAPPTDYAGDAKALDRIIVENYAYQDHWPGGTLPDSPQLAAERAAVHDHDSLLHYAEDRIASLADHHAITGSSFKDSWAIVPTYADLWIVRRGSDYFVDSVKTGSPAQQAGIVAGDRLTAIGQVPTPGAVAAFWSGLGLPATDERADYAARVLASGRRDRPRDITIRHGKAERRLSLPSLYTIQSDRPPITVSRSPAGETVILLNNSIGDQATIGAFDAAMAAIPLTAHQLPSEERETGIPRQWIEQVLPRSGKHHATLPVIRVGRWTGSMGEGAAIGFAALGARVEGTPMAQLKGAVYDFNLPSSGMVVKLPAERLYSIDGKAREDFVPGAIADPAK
jgi:hypothetical protein